MHGFGDVHQRITGEGVLEVEYARKPPALARACGHEVAGMKIVVAEPRRVTETRRLLTAAEAGLDEPAVSSSPHSRSTSPASNRAMRRSLATGRVKSSRVT
jgi:hypothetical protein